MVTKLHFGDMQKAWMGINEYLFLEGQKIEKLSGGLYGTEMLSYNNFVTINRAWVDPDFDFGKVLGYSYMKWSSLVGNYVNPRYLDLLRAEIGRRTGKKARSYNYSFHFSNLYGGGKDCLVSLIFTKRINAPHPIVVFTIRTSEVTKRLLFDFLLVQRIIEYIYGHNDVEVHFYAPSFYVTAESLVMYNNVKDLKKLLKKYKKNNPESDHKFHTKAMDVFDKFYNHPEPEAVTFRVNRRSMMQIQHDAEGNPKSGVKSMFAKDLLINREIFELPKDVISKSQIRKHQKSL